VNCRQALARARKKLEEYGIEDSSLEAEILLRYILCVNRAVLLSGLDNDITGDQTVRLSNLIEKRAWGEPSAYITGHKEFYGLDFKVDRRVLIPRPETELLVEKALEFCGQNKVSAIADIGTGSGCIAMSIASKLPAVKIYAVDISLPALEAAEENSIALNLKKRIEFLWGDLLKPLPEPVDMIIANLPYVRKAEVNSAYEPAQALNGGEDGLDAFRKLVPQIVGKLNPRGIVLLEIGMGQADALKTILHNVFSKCEIEIGKDLAGIERVVSLRLTS